ncbi:MAG: bifunctional [glutamine synthetase] adenylyltransferase/[glutamine synthetase]-adenylyl-L-tyrosine phosphorylase, partial [Pseudomonadota bacterium]
VDVEVTLRQAKAAAHAGVALLDLSGQDDLPQTTRRLSIFADAAVGAALRAAAGGQGLDLEGLGLVALGKMGAFELNYSSDIDMAAFYDPARFEGGHRHPGDAASRLVRQAMSILSSRTADGYVFRTDLRLRPDPSSTPLAVSMRRAELYYESVGQNWERMVWIKARHSASDPSVAAGLIRTLEPFVWRRHLDYWAIADVQAIKAMINAKAGDPAFEDRAPDLKLGPGGIREIEFFAQTQQVILGGRNPALRVTDTVGALEALRDHGVIGAPVCQELSEAYRVLRQVEHRLQMLDDEQTHTLPVDGARRAAVAALCGYERLEVFDQDLREIRRSVQGHYQSLFTDGPSAASVPGSGNLVFTGVDDDPRTVETLLELGFTAPSQVLDRIRQWHRGRTPATRTRRGRELLTALLPDLLQIMGQLGAPDEAFQRFSRFFEGLRAGVQTLSMLRAQPKLMQDLMATLALAPRIAETLGRRPSVLEALVSTSTPRAAPNLSAEHDFEAAMDAVRRWHAEQAFLIGHRLLQGELAASDAPGAWSDLAETCLSLMSQAAERETTRRFGPQPGRFILAALGKLGGRAMTAGSDLDLLVIYDAPGAASDAQSWYTRFTQRLITGLSAQTGEGMLYEVDMRLRPSGRAGPVATSLAAFERYHRDEAWTWEHMALTRLRCPVGDERLAAAVVKAAREAIVCAPRETCQADILDMRRRLRRDKPAQGPWDLKMRTGGLVDIEFLTQFGQLTTGMGDALAVRLEDNFPILSEFGFLTADEARFAARTYGFLSALKQIQRLAHGAGTTAESYSDGLKDRLCRAVRCDDFSELEQRLERDCAKVSALFAKKIGDLATE